MAKGRPVTAALGVGSVTDMVAEVAGRASPARPRRSFRNATVQQKPQPSRPLRHVVKSLAERRANVS
jgi:hypothetical protein